MNRSLLLLFCGCGGAEAPAPPFLDRKEESAKGAEQAEYDAAAEAPAAPAPTSAPAGGAPMGDFDGQLAGIGGGEGRMGRRDEATGKDKAPDDDAKPAEPESAAPTRAWFPETFLFAPLVVTDASGAAELAVTVPDRLTTWRILGLAHSAEGALAGSVTSFLGTLPVYVDPVLPPFVRAGDQLRLPVQVVNTTEEALTAPLRVSAQGAGEIGSAPGAVSLGAGQSAVASVLLGVPRSGELQLRASIGDSDAIERTIPALPTGRPLQDTRSGTLAAPRTLQIVGPYDQDPASAQVRLAVYPGALALLRAELTGALGRGGAAGDGYALLLAGQGDDLLEKLGEKPDEEEMREMSLLAAQRVIRHARAPDAGTAALLAEAAASHPDNPVLLRLSDRLLAQLAQQQRPDGTFEGGGGWTLQRLLVATADATAAVNAASRALPAEEADDRQRQAALVSLRASGAFERYAGQVEDPFTAAAMLASGAVEGELAAKLRERVRGAIKQADDGSRYLPPPEGAVRADGQAPSTAEATALAALALQGDPEAAGWLPDLGASLLGSYVAGYGWGDGRANLACLRAVLALFDDPLPPSVSITLEMDGQVVERGTFDAAALKDVLVLEAPGAAAAGPHTWTVRAEPAIPGLGFALTLNSWVPWGAPATGTGLEVTLERPATATVGLLAPITVQAAAPAGTPFTVEQNLPAGVLPDEPSLQALVSAGTLTGYEVHDGYIRLDAPALQGGQVLTARYNVIPTLGGLLHSGPTTIAPAGRPDLAVHVPPERWTIQ